MTDLITPELKDEPPQCPTCGGEGDLMAGGQRPDGSYTLHGEGEGGDLMVKWPS